jgi:hypothetical protein
MMKDSTKVVLTLAGVVAAFFGLHLYQQKQAKAATPGAAPTLPNGQPDPNAFAPNGMNAYGQTKADVTAANQTLTIQKLLIAWMGSNDARSYFASNPTVNLPSMIATVQGENGISGDGTRKAVEWFQVWADDNVMTSPNFIHGSGPGQNPVYGNLDPLTLKVLQQWAQKNGIAA